MQRLLVLLVCLGPLQAQMNIPIKTKPITQLLNNIKAKGTQAFVGDISVGTPPQPLPVTFDTGADVSYIVSVNCRDVVCTTRPQYDATASSTYQANGNAFELPFGQNVSGVLSQDVLSVAGVTVKNVTFGEITAVWSDWYNNLPQAGVIGLGPTAADGQGVRSLLDLLAEQGLIPTRQFGIWLGRDPSGGQLTLGGIDQRRYSGQMTWADLRSPVGSQWAVSAQEVTFEGRPELSMCAGAGGCSIAPSSSTPYFLMSQANAKAVNDALGGVALGDSGAVILDCTKLYELPNARIIVNGRTLEMTPLEYTFQLRFPNYMQMCISGFLGVGHLDDSTLNLGTLFMQKFYTAYDAENGRLGFADSV